MNPRESPFPTILPSKSSWPYRYNFIYIYIYISSALRALPATVPFLSLPWFPCCLDFESLVFTSKVFKFSIVFEAQAVILEVREPVWTISGAIGPPNGQKLKKRRKSALDGPPKTHTNVLFSVLRRCWFFVCSAVGIFVILSAQRHHLGFHFQAFLGALGLFKNSWKCRTVVIFRGLTPFRKSHLAGLESECVLWLSFYRNFRFGVVRGSQFWTLVGPIVVNKKQS